MRYPGQCNKTRLTCENYIANYKNFPGVSTKYEDISSISNSRFQWFPGVVDTLHEYTAPNGILIGSATLAQLTHVTNRQTDRPRHKCNSTLRIFGCQTMYNFVYLAKLPEPLVKHEKNLGSSACLFAELSSNWNTNIRHTYLNTWHVILYFIQFRNVFCIL